VFWKGVGTTDSRLQRFELDGLGKRVGSLFNPTVQISLPSDILVITDRPEYPHADRVFPLFSDENLFLAKVALTLRPRRVLDIGTGSGLLALLFAKHGATTIATEIIGRALRLAHFNSRLNNLTHAVDIRQGNVYGSLCKEKFDLIIANPPFVALPIGYPFHFAGHGGPDGCSVITEILRGAAEHLAEDGVMLLTSLSLQRSACTYVSELAQRLLGSSFDITTRYIYPKELRLKEFYGVFRGISTSHWFGTLEHSGFKSIAYVLLLVRHKSRSLRCVMPDSAFAIPLTKLSGSWQGRLKRYELWQSKDSLYD
jgi:SAM-dependent methyltransferase